ncbi:hypothetical protein Hanom_Chr17g01539151 [Helianthus anomalus]
MVPTTALMDCVIIMTFLDHLYGNLSIICFQFSPSQNRSTKNKFISRLITQFSPEAVDMKL